MDGTFRLLKCKACEGWIFRIRAVFSNDTEAGAIISNCTLAQRGFIEKLIIFHRMGVDFPVPGVWTIGKSLDTPLQCHLSLQKTLRYCESRGESKP